MSDQFGTRPGGGHGEATGGGLGDDRPLDDRPLDDRPLDDRPLDDIEGVAGADVGAGYEGSSVDLDDVEGADAVSTADPDDELSSEFPGGPSMPSVVPAWVGAASGAGLALVAIQGLVILGTISQGLAVERFQGDLFHKIGVAVLSNIGSANALMIVVGAALAALPAILGAPRQEMHLRRQALTFGLGAVLAILLVIATPIAVRARIFVIDAGGQTVDALARRVLATYVAGTLGTALVALATCLGLSRYSRTVTPRP